MEDELPSEYDAVVLGTGKRSAVKMFSLYMILSLQLQTMRLELGMKYNKVDMVCLSPVGYGV